VLRLRVMREHLIHKCVQCGFVVHYIANQPETCATCNATQRITLIDKKTSVTVGFVTDRDSYWRVWYHLSETNC